MLKKVFYFRLFFRFDTNIIDFDRLDENRDDILTEIIR